MTSGETLRNIMKMLVLEGWVQMVFCQTSRYMNSSMKFWSDLNTIYMTSMTDEIKELTRKKLELVEKTIAEIELTADKSRRKEWRELKKYQKWAKRELGL